MNLFNIFILKIISFFNSLFYIETKKISPIYKQTDDGRYRFSQKAYVETGQSSADLEFCKNTFLYAKQPVKISHSSNDDYLKRRRRSRNSKK